MKKVCSLLLLVLIFSGINAQESINTFSYRSIGRKFRETVVIRQDSTFAGRLTNNDTLVKSTVTTKETWDRLMQSIKKYSLKELENLPCPTNNRAVDGAMFSDIRISTKQKDYYCGQFDSHSPNEKLKDLLTIMLENLQ